MLKKEAWRAVELTMEAWELKMEPWRVCMPEVADLHHFDKIRIKVISWIRIRIRIKVKRRIWIRIKEIRIYKTGRKASTVQSHSAALLQAYTAARLQLIHSQQCRKTPTMRVCSATQF